MISRDNSPRTLPRRRVAPTAPGLRFSLALLTLLLAGAGAPGLARATEPASSPVDAETEKMTLHRVWAWKAKTPGLEPRAYRKYEKVLQAGTKKKLNYFRFEGKPVVRPLPSGKVCTIKLPGDYRLTVEPVGEKEKASVQIRLIPPKEKERVKEARLSRRKPSVILTPIQRRSEDGERDEQLIILIDYSTSPGGSARPD